MSDVRLHAKHSRAVRWMHWVNLPLLTLMLWSGLLIYWANDVYRIGVGQLTLFHFFPDAVYTRLHVDHRLAEGMALHFTLLWPFVLNGAAYCAFLAFSGEWRDLIPQKHALHDAWRVVRHDLHLSSRPLPPADKYNGAQRLVYTAILLMGVFSVLSGLAIYKPTQLPWLASLLGGYPAARWEHFLFALGYLVFFVVHVMQVARAGWNNLRAMITGYELVPTTDPDPAPGGQP
ncbi:MAG: cytochrome b/b6 domain-containing protein [Terriglobales bacterium]